MKIKLIPKIIISFLLFSVLTIITQIGGIVYLISKLISSKWRWKSRFKPMLSFLILYLFATLFVVPYIAPIFGRERVTHTTKIQATNYFTVLLNRNYVTPKLNALIQSTAEALPNNINIHYLDANFPFFNKFPLAPHLSHNDGKKIDLSLIYENTAGQISNEQKSISGYGVFENPKPNEYNQVAVCLKKGYFQYDFPKYLTLGSINTQLVFSNKGNSILIKTLLRQKELGKIFIEPHLKHRLQLNNQKIRYHGCKAVRHDDHIHIQLK